jgi:UDPglucose 6-dehydrogenase
MKLGIVGHGFVGTAVDHGFTRDVQKFIVDPKHNSTNTIEDLIKFRPDAVFVAVPTPQLESGECNTEILETVMQQLNTSKGLLVIVKSTVPAYKLQSIQEQCVDIRIVYNPEFLTEKNYITDFINPAMHVFGGINADTDAVEKLYLEHSDCRECPVFKVDLMTASMVKYCINSFLATKVTFMNEMYDVLKAARGADWNTFTKIIQTIHV